MARKRIIMRSIRQILYYRLEKKIGADEIPAVARATLQATAA